MSEEAKIHLSAFEMELVNNTEWIFTKQIIIDKVYHLFGQLNEDYKQIMVDEKYNFSAVIQKRGSKITKGEKYNRLPYVILDFPAFFSKENIFAVRTLFWWGNFFSISLHLSGEYYRQKTDIPKSINFLKEKDFFVCINESEWEHNFHSSNFINAKELNEKDFENIITRDFFKIAKKIELADWEKTPFFLKQSFKEIIEFIKISFPIGEKVL